MSVKHAMRAVLRYIIYFLLTYGLIFILYAWLLGFKQVELAQDCEAQKYTFNNGQTYTIALCYIWSDAANTATAKSLIRVYDSQNALRVERAFQYPSDHRAKESVFIKNGEIDYLDVTDPTGGTPIKIPPTLWDWIYARLP